MFFQQTCTSANPLPTSNHSKPPNRMTSYPMQGKLA